MSEKVIDEGGPAFPCPMSEQTVINQHCEPFQMGMSLRDYFAAHVVLDDVPLSAYEALVGAYPAYADPKIKLLWNATAEAAYRYLRADAMLKARQS